MEDGRIPWKTMVPPSSEGTVGCAIGIEDMIGLEVCIVGLNEKCGIKFLRVFGFSI